MKKETKHLDNEPITVELFVSGGDNRKEKISAIERLLRRDQTVLLNQKYFYVEDFKILQDS